MSLGSKLKALRIEKKLSQRELGDYLDVSARSIAFFEADTHAPKLANLKKLAELFGVTLDYLVTDKEDFILKAKEKYGYRGKKSAEELIYQTSTMFAGGNLSEEDKDAVFEVIKEIYFDSKEKNKKYTPKKYLDN